MRLEFIPKHRFTIRDVDIQSLKLGQKDVKPAVALKVQTIQPNGSLDMLDKSLRAFLFMKGNTKQNQLDDIEVVSDMPSLTEPAMKLGSLSWGGEQTGSIFTIHQGITGDQTITLKDCTVRKIKIAGKEGGSVEWTFQVYTSDVDEETLGALAVLKSLEKECELTAPEVQHAQQELVPKKTKRQTPAEALAAQLGQHE